MKLDDMDLSPETLVGGENGALVEVSLCWIMCIVLLLRNSRSNVHGSVIIKKMKKG